MSKGNGAPLLYYDARKGGGYWLRVSDTRFLCLDSAAARRHLRAGGRSALNYLPNGLNELEQEFLAAEVERHLDYAGPLAGHAPGIIQTQSGLRVLVSTGTQPVQAKRGPAGELKTFLRQLTGTDEQFEVLLSWLKVARESLLARDFRASQALTLAGPSGCGKSYLQSLITEWLGGRMAKPYRYMSGETPFNADLAGAEHWSIEDESGSTDIRTRLLFGAQLKMTCKASEMSVHGKGREARTLPTYRRLTISVNDQAERLMVLPPITDDLADCITLLKCSEATCLSEDRLKNQRTFSPQLAGLAYELERWPIPHRWRSSRYGVKHYHNPELLDALSDLTPERRLLNLVDQVLFGKAMDGPWTGSAEELEKDLRCSPFAFAADKLLYFPGAVGTYLGRLQREGRVTKATVRGKNLWTIAIP